MTESYFDYLSNISWRGLIYRRLLVYPIIRKYCKGKVLDVGCGMGQFVKYCNGSKGVDVNEECVEFCKKQELDVIQMEYDKLPFSDKSLDTVVLDNVIEHISDPLPLLRECRRVLTSTGTIIILVPGQKGFKQDIDHKQYYDHGALQNLMSVSNFIPSNCISLPFPNLSKILSPFCFMIVAHMPSE